MQGGSHSDEGAQNELFMRVCWRESILCSEKFLAGEMTLNLIFRAHTSQSDILSGC